MAQPEIFVICAKLCPLKTIQLTTVFKLPTGNVFKMPLARQSGTLNATPTFERMRHKDLNLGYAIRYYLKTLAGVGGAVLSYMFCSKALHLYKLTT